MASIGQVTLTKNGSYKGQLKTVSTTGSPLASPTKHRVKLRAGASKQKRSTSKSGSKSKPKHRPRPPDSSPPRSPGGNRSRKSRDCLSAQSNDAASRSPGRSSSPAHRRRSPGRSPKHGPRPPGGMKSKVKASARAVTSFPASNLTPQNPRHMPRPPAHPPVSAQLRGRSGSDALEVFSESDVTSDPDAELEESDASSASSPPINSKRASISRAGLPPVPGLPLPPAHALRHSHRRHPSTDGTILPPSHDAPTRPASKSVAVSRKSFEAAKSGGLPLPGVAGGLPVPSQRSSNVSHIGLEASDQSPAPSPTANGKRMNARPPGSPLRPNTLR